MEFLSVRDFRTSPKEVWGALERDGELVITNNGKPTAIMIHVDGATLEEKLMAYRQAEAMRLFNKMRKTAAESGFMTDDEIEREISAARAELAEKRASL